MSTCNNCRNDPCEELVYGCGKGMRCGSDGLMHKCNEECCICEKVPNPLKANKNILAFRNNTKLKLATPEEEPINFLGVPPNPQLSYPSGTKLRVGALSVVTPDPQPPQRPKRVHDTYTYRRRLNLFIEQPVSNRRVICPGIGQM